MKKQEQRRMTVMEAVDNLSSMAEIDSEIPADKIRKGAIYAPDSEWSETKAARWIDPKRETIAREEIKETFRVLKDYLENLYKQKSSELKNPETQQGIQAIMVLVQEAGKKLDQYRSIFQKLDEEKITEFEEYRNLQKVYLTKIVHKFEKNLGKPEEWEKKWGPVGAEVYDLKEKGLKDLETVKQDKEYELFSVIKEDSKPYFNQNLLRHIRLVGNFDQLYTEIEEDDPFLRVRLALDRDLHQTAKEIKKWVGKEIDAFYLEAMAFKDRPFVAYLNKGLMALLLAANARNLIPNTEGKSCIGYFNDFHHYLRQSLSCDQYKQFISYPPDVEEKFYHTLLDLSHSLCCSFFMRIGSRKEMISLIHRLVEQKVQSEPKKRANHPHSIWEQLLDEDEHMRYLLERYPNGPLMKAFDAFRQRENGKGFDPLAQENYPSLLYTLVSSKLHSSFVRLPCPTFQKRIDQAEVVEEFRGLLRYFKAEVPGKRHLLFNLQDRTSWKEHARCRALEELQNDSEFESALNVVTLPKHTDFYRQEDLYKEISDSREFKRLLLEQVEGGADCGFFFPKTFTIKEIGAYSQDAIELVHNLFFDGEKKLSREQRLDFIEIFYLFFSFYFIRELFPDSVSFTCKDAIDFGAAMSTSFFAFSRMLSSDLPWSGAERDFLLWMLYAPGLIVRERTTEVENLHRMVSSMQIISEKLAKKRKVIEKAVFSLIGKGVFTKLRVEEAS